MEIGVMMLLFWIVFWMYVCVQGELPLCALPSDDSTTNKENIRSVICVSTSILTRPKDWCLLPSVGVLK